MNGVTRTSNVGYRTVTVLPIPVLDVDLILTGVFFVGATLYTDANNELGVTVATASGVAPYTYKWTINSPTSLSVTNPDNFNSILSQGEFLGLSCRYNVMTAWWLVCCPLLLLAVCVASLH